MVKHKLLGLLICLTANVCAQPAFLASNNINLKFGHYKSGAYTGDMANGKPHGYGLYLFADSSFYVGHFDKGSVSGNGLFYQAKQHVIMLAKRGADGALLSGDIFQVYPQNKSVSLLKYQDSLHSREAVKLAAGKTILMAFDFAENEAQPYVFCASTGKHTASADYSPNLNGRLANGPRLIFDANTRQTKVEVSENGIYKFEVANYPMGPQADGQAEAKLGKQIPAALKNMQVYDRYQNSAFRFIGANPNQSAGYRMIWVDSVYVQSSWGANNGVKPFVREVIKYKNNRLCMAMGRFDVNIVNNMPQRTGEGIRADFTDSSAVELFFGELANENNRR